MGHTVGINIDSMSIYSFLFSLLQKERNGKGEENLKTEILNERKKKKSQSYVLFSTSSCMYYFLYNELYLF